MPISVKAPNDGPDARILPGPFYKKEISGVEEQVRWLRHNFGQSANVSYGDKKFFEKNLYWADSSFTTLFDIPFVYGNPHDALNKPGAIIISESIAQKYFGKDNPLGKVLRIDNRTDCAITGVYKDFLPTPHSMPTSSVRFIPWSG
jgi:hypothetical protein